MSSAKISGLRAGRQPWQRGVVRGALVFTVGVATLAAPPCRATVVYEVASVVDAADVDAGDGACLSSANGCTLRAAFQQASATAANGPDKDIEIRVPPGLYPLTLTAANSGNAGPSGALRLGGAAPGSSIRVRGWASGQPASAQMRPRISASTAFGHRLLAVNTGAPVQLEDVVLEGAHAQGLNGGVIHCHSSVGKTGSVQLIRTIIRGNVSEDYSGLIHSEGCDFGMSQSSIEENIGLPVLYLQVTHPAGNEFTIERSSIAANVRADNESSPSVLKVESFLGQYPWHFGLSNVTMSENDGALELGAHIADGVSTSTAEMRNVTLVGLPAITTINAVKAIGDVNIRVSNSAILGSSRATEFAHLESLGNNILGTVQMANQGQYTPHVTDLAFMPGVELLGPLLAVSEYTLGHSPVAQSVLVDGGNPLPPEDADDTRCRETDQRDMARPAGLACDIGAIERSDVDIFRSGFEALP